ncbi:MAG: hypothetical protein Q7U51_04105 [Methanoregula sp.]|nr:hypothetical protein [Methanoregula sp.]
MSNRSLVEVLPGLVIACRLAIVRYRNGHRTGRVPERLAEWAFIERAEEYPGRNVS